MIVGIDTGGTFTDFIVYDGGNVRNHKQLSTPDAPERAILDGLKALGLDHQSDELLTIVHGTTVATNAALENKGVSTAYITNTGLADVLSISRQNRPELYNLTPSSSTTPVPRSLCFEIDVRRDSQGQAIQTLKEDDIATLVSKIKAANVDAVAINFLFSYLNGDDEKAIQAALPDTLFISCSHEIIPIEREYERGIATWLNSWLSPKVAHYFQRLAQGVGQNPIHIMQSSGGTTDIQHASKRAVDLLLSGPAGGLAAAKAIADQTDMPKLLTFDMGGTSTDVALIDGDIALTQEGHIGPYPVAVPMIDMITIGAGGGSLAFVDNGGMLHVGPESAGAKPGPACYLQGGTQATVTDANVVLTRIPHDTKLGGTLPISPEASLEAVSAIAKDMNCTSVEAAEGIVTIANEHMTQALRRISIERGHNPAEFTLCCFGGAGGLHICDLAEALDIKHAIVPQYSGLLSALGMVVAPAKSTQLKTYLRPVSSLTDNVIKDDIQSLLLKSHTELSLGSEENITERSLLTLRFSGQNHALDIAYEGSLLATVEQFQAGYKERYGVLPQKAIEAVHVSIQRQGYTEELPPAVHRSKTDIEGHQLERDLLPVDLKLQGPKTVIDSYATTHIKSGWSFYRDRYGHLILSRSA